MYILFLHYNNIMDNLSKEQRKKNMKAIRSTGTQIETIACKALWSNGIKFRKNIKNLPGKPDIAIKKYKIAIFLDSCFWHKCPFHFKQPKSNQTYWNSKIARNIARDREVNEYYKAHGWNLLRIWEHQLKSKDERENTVKNIIDFIENAKEKVNNPQSKKF